MGSYSTPFVSKPLFVVVFVGAVGCQRSKVHVTGSHSDSVFGLALRGFVLNPVCFRTVVRCGLLESSMFVFVFDPVCFKTVVRVQPPFAFGKKGHKAFSRATGRPKRDTPTTGRRFALIFSVSAWGPSLLHLRASRRRPRRTRSRESVPATWPN